MNTAWGRPTFENHRTIDNTLTQPVQLAHSIPTGPTPPPTLAQYNTNLPPKPSTHPQNLASIKGNVNWQEFFNDLAGIGFVDGSDTVTALLTLSQNENAIQVPAYHSQTTRTPRERAYNGK